MCTKITEKEMGELHLITSMGGCPERQNRFPNLLCMHCCYINRMYMVMDCGPLRGCEQRVLYWWQARKHGAKGGGEE